MNDWIHQNTEWLTFKHSCGSVESLLSLFIEAGVDTQGVFAFGTPDQVKEQVKRQCDILNKNEGFVFNTVHNIQANVPFENVVAMLEALREL